MQENFVSAKFNNNMENKKVGIAIVAMGAIILGIIIYVIFFAKFNAPTTTPAVVVPAAQVQPATNTVPQANIQERKNTFLKNEVTDGDLKIIAMAFAERFGSFSNQNNYSHLKDLKVFMSTKMQQWADSYIAKAQAETTSNTIYQGMTTKAVSSKVEGSINNVSREAKVVVTTQRREATGTANNATTYYQDLAINFVKENTTWKVDGAFWQDKK